MRDDEQQQSLEQKPLLRREMSRRQFLCYTLGGTGAFMAAGTIVPMLRFAVDPLISAKGEAEWVKVIEESKVTSTPTEVNFTKRQVDGWYVSEPKFAAWIARDPGGKVYALSPICKHLGCTVQWNSDARFPNLFFCPCHEARYDINGKNLAVAPLPLDEYDVKVENGWVYLGQIVPNRRVK